MLCVFYRKETNTLKASLSIMRAIYAGCFFTIAAAHSTDTNPGCFRTRYPLHMEDCNSIDLNNTTWTFAYIPDPDACGIHDGAIPLSPLSKRGWVFQERIMSPRTIHFTKDEVIFKCREQVFCPRCADFPRRRQRLGQQDLPGDWRSRLHISIDAFS